MCYSCVYFPGNVLISSDDIDGTNDDLAFSAACFSSLSYNHLLLNKTKSMHIVLADSLHQ